MLTLCVRIFVLHFLIVGARKRIHNAHSSHIGQLSLGRLQLTIRKLATNSETWWNQEVAFPRTTILALATATGTAVKHKGRGLLADCFVYRSKQKIFKKKKGKLKEENHRALSLVSGHRNICESYKSRDCFQQGRKKNSRWNLHHLFHSYIILICCFRP